MQIGAGINLQQTIHISRGLCQLVPTWLSFKSFNGLQNKYLYDIFNIPGVAGAVLLTASSLIHSFIHSLTNSLMVCGNIFQALSIPNQKS